MNVYMRLLIPNVISSEISKVIYLDVDLIFQQDVSLLWNISIEENIVAAVADQSIKMVSNYGGIANYKEFGLLETTKYFNSGVLIMDVKKWVSFNVAEKVIKCINANKKYVMWADQYGLNVVLANNWFELDLLWNYQAKFEGEDPFVIHFAGRKPIFKSYENKEIYQTIFFKYLKQTEWRGFEPIGEATRYFKKIKNILEKHL
jgi:lipopolysaccharide biosynthesis glycosyltransferase